MSDKDELGAFLLGFIVGGLSGAVTALLLAPQSGEQTRTQIKDVAIELRDRAGDTVDDTYAQAEALAEEARARFDEVSRITKERAQEMSDLAKQKADELQQRGQVMVEQIRKTDSGSSQEAA